MVEDEGRFLAQVSCTTSTSVKCTFKNKTKEFMTRPNVLNGLAATSSVNVCTKPRAADLAGDESKRPPFITNVTRGRFLPSKFDLLLEKSLFTFSSRPRPVGLVSKHQCSLFTPRKEIPPRGVHDYFNVMWDPHIVRGTTATTSKSFVNNEFGPKVQETSASAGEPSTRKKRSSNLLKTKISQNTTSHLSPLRKDGRVHSVVQTECYLEEINGETEESDASVQTDFESFTFSNEFGVGCGSSSVIPCRNGVDAATEVIPGDLYDFDQEIRPVLESLVAKIIEQAMFETIEEEEIAALREQRNYFQEQRIQEERELKKLLEQKERIRQEKESIRRHLDLEKVDLEKLVETSGGVTGYSTSYLLELLPSVLNSLRQEGFLSDNVEDDSFSGYPPWERSTVEVEVHETEVPTEEDEDRGERLSTTTSANEELTRDAEGPGEASSINNSTEDGSRGTETDNDTTIEQLPKDE